MQRHVFFYVWHWDLNETGEVKPSACVSITTVDPRPSEHYVVIGEADIDVVLYPKINPVEQLAEGIRKSIDELADKYHKERGEKEQRLKDLLCLPAPTATPLDDDIPF